MKAAVVVANEDVQYLEIPDRQKFDALCRFLDMQSPELAIVFVRTKRRADEVTEALKKRGYSAEGIHGDLSQAKRDSVIRQFKENTIDILVATDVAARGLDISGVTHVYNFDLPQDPETYVHRVGRTGRAGNTGKAITFVVSREMGQFRAIERAIRRRIPRRAMPTLSEVIQENQRVAIASLAETAQGTGLEEFKENAEELLNDIDSTSLVAAAIKLLTKQPDVTPVRITADAPQRRRGGFRGNRSNFHHRRDGSRTGRNGERRGFRKRHDNNRDKRENKESNRPKESSFKPYFKD